MKQYKTLTIKECPYLIDDIHAVLEENFIVGNGKYGAYGFSVFFVTKEMADEYEMPPECIGCWYRTEDYDMSYHSDGLGEDAVLYLCEKVIVEKPEYQIIE